MFYNVPFLPELTGRIEELAKKKGASMAQIAIAWILAKPGVTAPIVGTTSLSNLEDILGEHFSSIWSALPNLTVDFRWP